MRVFLKRLTALAICVLAALPVLQVRVTAYAPVPRCTKKINPDITASGHRIVPADHYRLVAFSPDLAKQFKFGDRFDWKSEGSFLLLSTRTACQANDGKRSTFFSQPLGAARSLEFKRENSN